MCVCVGGGGGGGDPFFYLQITKRLCGLVALADSCRGKKDILFHYIIYYVYFLTCTSVITGLSGGMHSICCATFQDVCYQVDVCQGRDGPQVQCRLNRMA